MSVAKIKLGVSRSNLGHGSKASVNFNNSDHSNEGEIWKSVCLCTFIPWKQEVLMIQVYSIYFALRNEEEGRLKGGGGVPGEEV